MAGTTCISLIVAFKPETQIRRVRCKLATQQNTAMFHLNVALYPSLYASLLPQGEKKNPLIYLFFFSFSSCQKVKRLKWKTETNYYHYHSRPTVQTSSEELKASIWNHRTELLKTWISLRASMTPHGWCPLCFKINLSFYSVYTCSQHGLQHASLPTSLNIHVVHFKRFEDLFFLFLNSTANPIWWFPVLCFNFYGSLFCILSFDFFTSAFFLLLVSVTVRVLSCTPHTQAHTRSPLGSANLSVVITTPTPPHHHPLSTYDCVPHGAGVNYEAFVVLNTVVASPLFVPSEKS